MKFMYGRLHKSKLILEEKKIKNILNSNGNNLLIATKKYFVLFKGRIIIFLKLEKYQLTK